MWNLEEITEEIYGGIDFIGTKKFKEASHRGIKVSDNITENCLFESFFNEEIRVVAME